MAFGGQLYIATGNQEPWTITEAIVTSDRIFVEWIADGQVGQLEATSSDGVLFRGEFHRPLDGPPGVCDLTLFKSLHEHLLFGVWQNPSTAERGTWAFRLQTDVVRPNRSAVARSASDLPLKPSQVIRRPAMQVDMAEPSGESLKTRSGAPRSVHPALALPSSVPDATAPVDSPNKAVLSAPATTMFSNQLDHLLSLTSEEFATKDQKEIEVALAVAPSSALFKVSRSAAAPELRALAAIVIERQRAPSEMPVQQPVSEPIVDPKTMRAHQRRSSKHWKS